MKNEVNQLCASVLFPTYEIQISSRRSAKWQGSRSRKSLAFRHISKYPVSATLVFLKFHVRMPGSQRKTLKTHKNAKSAWHSCRNFVAFFRFRFKNATTCVSRSKNTRVPNPWPPCKKVGPLAFLLQKPQRARRPTTLRGPLSNTWPTLLSAL
jgi:hypothetical protein